MKRWLSIAWFAAIAVLPVSHPAQAQRAQYEALVAKHAKANLVPEALVHRVIRRESGYRAELQGRGGTIGLMQIKLATARGLGYTGDAEGLRDPDTNLTYAVRYLAGAYRAANGDHDRAVHYYASGYYQVAKQQRLERLHPKPAGPVLASAPPADAAKPPEAAKPEEAASETPKPDGKPDETAKPEEAATFAERAQPIEALAAASKPATPKQATGLLKESSSAKTASVKPKRETHKRLAEAKETTREPIPRPPASIPGGANTARPR
jgi:Transglycosylase SLT domain